METRFRYLVEDQKHEITEEYEHSHSFGLMQVIDMETGIVYSGLSDEGTGNLGEELKMYLSEYYFNDESIDSKHSLRINCKTKDKTK